MKMTRNVLIMMAIFTANLAYSQESYYNQKYKEKIQQLSQMVGEWKGSGWAMNKESRTKEEFTVKEEVKYTLDSTVFYIQGKGIDPNGSVVHDALGVISVNDEGGFYMTSFLGDGRSGKYELKKKDNQWEWKIPLEQGKIVYTITLTATTWQEEGVFVSGEYSYPFFEMNLKRQP